MSCSVDVAVLMHVDGALLCVTYEQGCYRYFPNVSPIFDIDAGFKSIVDTDIDTLP